MSKQKQQKKSTSTPLTPTMKPEPMDTDSKDGSEKISSKVTYKSFQPKFVTVGIACQSPV